MEAFLRERGLEEVIIAKFTHERIDAHVAALMTDEQFKDLGVEHFGDRIAIKAYATSHTSATNAEVLNLDKDQGKQGKLAHDSQSLLARIREKLENPKKSGSKPSRITLIGNKNAEKMTRRVEIGWLMKSGKELKQVRSQKGGGTRHAVFDISHTVEDVKNKALELFFPNGQSVKKGNIDEYDVSMTNFDHSPLENVTVQQLYEKCRVRLLRLYLCTSPRKGDEHKLEEVPKQEECRKNLNASSDSLPSLVGQTGSSQHVEEIVKTFPEHSSFDAAEGLTEIYKMVEAFPEEITNQHISDNSTSENIATTISVESGSTSTDGSQGRNALVMSLSSDLEVDIALDQLQTNIADVQNVYEHFQASTGSGIFLEPVHNAVVEPVHNAVVTLTLHRGHVLEEFENFFLQNDFDLWNQLIQVQMILPNGEVELAEDNGGVLRDVLSEYWESFYFKRTMGEELKVPALSHTLDGKRWESVAKIIILGYKQEKYFPTELATCFLEYAVNRDTIPVDILMAQYLKYLPSNERSIAEACLNNIHVEEDDLLDFLGDHRVKVKPTKENIKRILQEMAHEELIQHPTFVADCWRELLLQLKPLIPSSFLEMNSLLPTFKVVWQSLRFENDANQEIISYLKKYLKGLAMPQLKDFLRFCTGADIFLGKTISVRLVPSPSDFARRPISHTCGCVLEVPNSYGTFVELRNDFSTILNASVWSMDIV